MKHQIESIEITPLRVPFKDYVIKAMDDSEGNLGMATSAEERWLGGDFVIIQLKSKSGIIGLGESFVWLPETGVSPFQIIDSIKNSLANYVIGENPFDINKINYRMEINLARNEVAKGLIDMALYDLIGKIKEEPAFSLMGGKKAELIPLAALIPLGSPMLMKGLTRSYFKRGYQSFRLKLGKSIEQDKEIVQTIRKALGNEIHLRVDYNQAYTPETAIKAINTIEPYGIDYAEEPVSSNDFLGMAYVQKNVNVPLMSHEGFFSLRDFITLVELNAVGVLGINSERPGGVTNALKAIDYAKKKDIGVVLHNQPLGVASAMHLHLHAAKFDVIDFATELFGQEMLVDDLIINPINYSNGYARIPEGAGWGVKLDKLALNRYTIAESIVIE